MELKISNRTIIRILILMALFLGFILLLGLVKAQLVWLAIAFFLALALEPAVKKLSKVMPWHSRALSVVTVFIALVIVVGFVIYTLAPPLISETEQLIKNAPKYTDNFLKSANPLSDYLRSHNLMDQFTKYQGQIGQKAVTYGGSAIGLVGSIFNSILALVTILTFTFFMVLEGPKIMTAFWRYQPAEKRAHRQEVAKKMHRTVNDYVNGNLLTSLIAAITTGITLKLLGIPYTIALGILVGIFDLIPLIGASLAAVVITLLVLVLGGLKSAIIILIFFLIYQQIESIILQPLVYSKSVKISPLVVGIAGLFGAIIAGLIGALVAIPLAASLQILVKDYLENKNL